MSLIKQLLPVAVVEVVVQRLALALLLVFVRDSRRPLTAHPDALCIPTAFPAARLLNSLARCVLGIRLANSASLVLLGSLWAWLPQDPFSLVRNGIDIGNRRVASPWVEVDLRIFEVVTDHLHLVVANLG